MRMIPHGQQGQYMAWMGAIGVCHISTAWPFIFIVASPVSEAREAGVRKMNLFACQHSADTFHSSRSHHLPFGCGESFCGLQCFRQRPSRKARAIIWFGECRFAAGGYPEWRIWWMD